jgi:hypothetical protein
VPAWNILGKESDMKEHNQGLLDTAAYAAALAFARGLRAPDKPLDFPNYTDYVRLVAEQVVIDLEAYEPDMADFHELPEAYELAYLTARLERLRARILAEKGLDVGTL